LAGVPLSSSFKRFSTGLLTFSFLTLTTACSKYSDGAPNSGFSGDTNSISGEAELPSTALTQEDLKLIGDADVQEAKSYYGSETAGTIAGLSAGYKRILGNIGDLSAPFEGIAACSTLVTGLTSQMNINCPGVVGTVTRVLDIGTFSISQDLNLEVTSAQGHAVIKHQFAQGFDKGGTRTINDVIKTSAMELTIQGNSVIHKVSNDLSFSGDYNVSKNSGVVETISISSANVQLGNCGVNSGTVTYTTGSGLSHTVTIPGCPEVAPPNIPGFPIPPFNFPPIILPPIAIPVLPGTAI
jgi:hypothetical protein